MYNKYNKGQKFADNAECKPNCSAAESLTVGPVGALSEIKAEMMWTGQSGQDRVSVLFVFPPLFCSTTQHALLNYLVVRSSVISLGQSFCAHKSTKWTPQQQYMRHIVMLSKEVCPHWNACYLFDSTSCLTFLS